MATGSNARRYQYADGDWPDPALALSEGERDALLRAAEAGYVREECRAWREADLASAAETRADRSCAEKLAALIGRPDAAELLLLDLSPRDGLVDRIFAASRLVEDPI